MKRFLKLVTCSVMALSLFVTQTAWAGLVPTQDALTTQQTQEQRTEVLTLLERQDVQDALIAQGISPEEAKLRITALSDAELTQLKNQIDSLPAGAGAVGAIVAAVLIVFFVLLFTDLLGETDAYDFDD